MRKLFCLLAVGVILAGAASSQAATVSFTGEISIRIGSLTPLPVPAASGTASLQTAGGVITQLTIGPGQFATAITAPVPNAFPIIQIKFQGQQGAGPLVNSAIQVAAGGACTAQHPNVTCPGGGLAGFGGLNGTALVGIFTFTTHLATSVTSTPTNMGLQFPAANLIVPLNAVGGGSTVMTVGLGIKVAVSGAGWTSGTASIVNSTNPVITHVPAATHAPPTISLQASDNLQIGTGTTETTKGSQMATTMGGFAVSLVSPVQLFNTATSAFSNTVVKLDITTSAPEAGATALFFGAMSTVSLLYGLRRRRRK